MKNINTSNIFEDTSFINVVINNIPNNGLWMFDHIRPLSNTFFK